MPQTEYKRLTHASARSAFSVAFTSRSSLWLGGDHLLNVDTSGFTENYKRFFFRDIQAITIQKTMRWQVWNFIWGTAIFIALVAGLVAKPVGTPSSWSGDEAIGLIFFSGLTVLFAIFLFTNFFLGATCKTYLRTAVQIEELPSLKRIRKTRTVLEKIRPLIAAAQGGELTPQIVVEKIREQIHSPPNAAASVAENPDLPPKLDI